MRERSDYISRLFYFDDWQITPEFFFRLEEIWGLHTYDCFANFIQWNSQDSFPAVGTRRHQAWNFLFKISVGSDGTV